MIYFLWFKFVEILHVAGVSELGFCSPSPSNCCWLSKSINFLIKKLWWWRVMALVNRSASWRLDEMCKCDTSIFKVSTNEMAQLSQNKRPWSIVLETQSQSHGILCECFVTREGTKSHLFVTKNLTWLYRDAD